MKFVRSKSRRLNLVGGFSMGMLILAAGCSPPNDPDEDNTSNIPIVGVGTLLVKSDSNSYLRWHGGIAWSADGEEVIYAVDTYRNHGISVKRININTLESRTVRGSFLSITNFGTSPNGEYLSFVQGNEPFNLYLADAPDYAAFVPLDSVVWTEPYVWSPDSRLVAYVSSRPWNPELIWETTVAIWDVVNHAQVESFQIPGKAFPMAFSPAGDQLLMGEYNPNWLLRRHLGLSVLDLTTKTSTHLDSLIAWPISGPWIITPLAFWDEAGIQVIYRPENTRSIAIYSGETQSSRMLAEEAGILDSWNIAGISPDHSRLALWFHELTGFVGSRAHLYVVDIQSGDINLIANHESEISIASQAAFSPDGTKIAYLYLPNGSNYQNLNIYYQEL